MVSILSSFGSLFCQPKLASNRLSSTSKSEITTARVHIRRYGIKIKAFQSCD